MKINANEIRVGMLLEYKDDLWQVLKTQHVKPGKGGAFAQVEMKSVNKNTKLNERFRSSETIEKASVEETNFNYLYDDENNYFFMDPKSFEQIEIKSRAVAIKRVFTNIKIKGREIAITEIMDLGENGMKIIAFRLLSNQLIQFC